jgi:hypothetical protein
MVQRGKREEGSCNAHDTRLKSKSESPQGSDVLVLDSPSMFRVRAGKTSWSGDVDLFGGTGLNLL